MGGSGTNGWWFRADSPYGGPPHRVTFRLATAHFEPFHPDAGTGEEVMSARDDLGQINEGRKGATEGRKENVNDRRGTRDLGLASVWSSTPRAPRMLARMRPGDRNSREWRRDGCLGLHRAHGVDLRRARPCAEVGRRTVSFENIVGLVLAVLTALYLAGALLFPERF
jgi:hypothetical protein